MAQAIQHISRTVKTEADIEAEKLRAVERETAIDADGVIQGLKLLQALQDRGVLEILVALCERGDKVVGHLVDVLGKPGASGGLQTALVAVQSLGQLDANAVSRAVSGLSAGLDRIEHPTPRSKPVGLFDLIGVLKDPDVNAAIATGIDFLQGMGQSIRAGQEQKTAHGGE